MLWVGSLFWGCIIGIIVTYFIPRYENHTPKTLGATIAIISGGGGGGGGLIAYLTTSSNSEYILSLYVIGFLLGGFGYIVITKPQKDTSMEGNEGGKKGAPPPPVSEKVKIFFSAPMAAHKSDDDYKKSREEAINIINMLNARHKVEVFYAGRNISSQNKFDTELASIKINMSELENSDLFIMLYPEKLVSSVLVEAGMALAKNTRSIYFIKNRNHLPYLLKEIQGNRIKI